MTLEEDAKQRNLKGFLKIGVPSITAIAYLASIVTFGTLNPFKFNYAYGLYMEAVECFDEDENGYLDSNEYRKLNESTGIILSLSELEEKVQSCQ